MDEPAFNLKDYLLNIIGKLDRLETKLDGKAEVAAVQAIDIRLTAVEKVAAEATIIRTQLLIPQMERLSKDVDVALEVSGRLDAVDSYKRWLIVTAFTAIGAAVATISQLFMR